MRLVVDLDVLLADPGFREALLAQGRSQRELACDDVAGDYGVPALHGEAIAQSRGALSCGFEARQAHRGEAILLPRVGAKNDPNGLALALGAWLDDGVIIALATEKLGQELGICPGPAIDLCHVSGLAMRETPAKSSPRSTQSRSSTRRGSVNIDEPLTIGKCLDK